MVGGTPVTGRLYADSSATGGALSCQRIMLTSGASGAAPHHHNRSSELFYVVSGAAEMLAGGRVLSAHQGDLVVVPRALCTRSRPRPPATPTCSSATWNGSPRARRGPRASSRSKNSTTTISTKPRSGSDSTLPRSQGPPQSRPGIPGTAAAALADAVASEGPASWPVGSARNRSGADCRFPRACRALRRPPAQRPAGSAPRGLAPARPCGFASVTRTGPRAPRACVGPAAPAVGIVKRGRSAWPRTVHWTPGRGRAGTRSAARGHTVAAGPGSPGPPVRRRRRHRPRHPA